MSLQDQKRIKTVAFAWGGTTRVFRAQAVEYTPIELREEWETADRNRNYNTDGYHLDFQITNGTLQLTSPATPTGNGPVEVINALNDPTVTVTFYPIYDIDATVNYEVKKLGGGTTLVQTKKTVIKPALAITVGTVAKLASLPTWLNTHRTR